MSVSERTDRSEPWAGRRLHFIAIGGAGMSALALVAARLGAQVTGSDRAESSYVTRLREAGLEPRIGHDARAVPSDAEVVISTAITEDNPELMRAREQGHSILHRGQLLAEVCRLKRLIAVAGAHGKTTTAALIAFALRQAGAEPAFLLGGELGGVAEEDGTNALWGAGEWIVAEADESDGSFLELDPEIAVITNVELDHHSHWASETALLDAFGRFAARAERVVEARDSELDPLSEATASNSPLPATGSEGERRRLRFGIENRVRERRAQELAQRSIGQARGENGEPAPDPRPAASVLDVAAVGLSTGAAGSSFALRLPDGARIDIELPLPGVHNILNALAALGALYLVADGDEAQLSAFAAALREFPGVRRRLERKGSCNGATIFDDYAHHPTEVAAALASFSDPSPRRLIAVFQPHLYSRTKALASRFGKALAVADEIVVLDVYPAREEPVGDLAGVSGRQIADAAADCAGGRPVWWLADLASAERALKPRLREGDVLVTLGAGDVFELADRLVEPAGGESKSGSVDRAGPIDADRSDDARSEPE